jgi:hypothetical protein
MRDAAALHASAPSHPRGEMVRAAPGDRCTSLPASPRMAAEHACRSSISLVLLLCTGSCGAAALRDVRVCVCVSTGVAQHAAQREGFRNLLSDAAA